MAKKSKICKEKKRSLIVTKFYDQRKTLREIVKNLNASDEDKQAAQFRLQKLPRDSSFIRVRNRCDITGRPHGYYRKFGLSRNKLREAVMRGDVPGVTKASW